MTVSWNLEVIPVRLIVEQDITGVSYSRAIAPRLGARTHYVCGVD